jgi:hypothetical protein
VEELIIGVDVAPEGKKKSGDASYNTNLASEYLMMSLLSRCNKDAYLSLGNKKGVDIIIKTDSGAICILEVKGVNKINDWLICNNGCLPSAPNLFYSLICFQGKIQELTSPADIWLIPSVKLSGAEEHKISKNGKTVYISFSHIVKHYGVYKNNFEALSLYLQEH